MTISTDIRAQWDQLTKMTSQFLNDFIKKDSEFIYVWSKDSFSSSSYFSMQGNALARLWRSNNLLKMLLTHFWGINFGLFTDSMKTAEKTAHWAPY